MREYYEEQLQTSQSELERLVLQCEVLQVERDRAVDTLESLEAYVGTLQEELEGVKGQLHVARKLATEEHDKFVCENARLQDFVKEFALSTASTWNGSQTKVNTNRDIDNSKNETETVETEAEEEDDEIEEEQEAYILHELTGVLEGADESSNDDDDNEDTKVIVTASEVSQTQQTVNSTNRPPISRTLSRRDSYNRRAAEIGFLQKQTSYSDLYPELFQNQQPTSSEKEMNNHIIRPGSFSRNRPALLSQTSYSDLYPELFNKETHMTVEKDSNQQAGSNRFQNRKSSFRVMGAHGQEQFQVANSIGGSNADISKNEDRDEVDKMVTAGIFSIQQNDNGSVIEVQDKALSKEGEDVSFDDDVRLEDLLNFKV